MEGFPMMDKMERIYVQLVAYFTRTIQVCCANIVCGEAQDLCATWCLLHSTIKVLICGHQVAPPLSDLRSGDLICRSHSVGCVQDHAGDYHGRHTRHPTAYES